MSKLKDHLNTPLQPSFTLGQLYSRIEVLIEKLAGNPIKNKGKLLEGCAVILGDKNQHTMFARLDSSYSKVLSDVINEDTAMLSDNKYSLLVHRLPTFGELKELGMDHELAASVKCQLEHNCPQFPAFVACVPVVYDEDLDPIESDTIEDEQSIALGNIDGWLFTVNQDQSWCELVSHPAPKWKDVDIAAEDQY